MPSKQAVLVCIPRSVYVDYAAAVKAKGMGETGFTFTGFVIEKPFGRDLQARKTKLVSSMTYSMKVACKVNELITLSLWRWCRTFSPYGLQHTGGASMEQQLHRTYRIQHEG
jgi:hypothetical protein